MLWDTHNRKFWDVGERNVLRLSAARCQSILFALVACDGKVTSTFSLDVRDGRTTPPGMKPHQCAVLLRISLPVGAEGEFERLSGEKLEEPKVIHANTVSVTEAG